MQRAEYWLLECVVESLFLIEWLLRDDLELYLNRQGHGLSASELTMALHLLFQRGDIVAYFATTQPLDRYGEPFTPSVDEINSGLAGELHLIYQLTAQGGARWEQSSSPRWDKYIENEVSFEEGWSETVGMKRSFVEQYIDMIHLLNDGSLIQDSLIWDEIRPWDATYWKTLPYAHRARYKSNWGTTSEERRGNNAPDWVKNWFETNIINWYTSPFDQ